jgi:hypothetical protein
MQNDSQAEAVRRAVVVALRSAIEDGGPITADRVGSAARRILGSLAGARTAALGSRRDRRGELKRRYRLGPGSRAGL